MTIRRSLIVLAAGLALAGCGEGGDTAQDAASETTTSTSAVTPTAVGSSTSTPPSTDAASSTPATPPMSAAPEHDEDDVRFASMMVPHHRQAVEMADLVLGKQGVDPQVTELARRIRDAQAPEIEAMDAWLTSWGAEQGGHTDHAGHMDGMLDEKQMAALREADGASAGRLFLEGMIEHHEGAVDMAEDELEKGTNPQAKELARQIVTSQQAEIATMRSMLDR